LDGDLEAQVVRAPHEEVAHRDRGGTGHPDGRAAMARPEQWTAVAGQRQERVDGVPDRMVLEPPAAGPEAEADHPGRHVGLGDRGRPWPQDPTSQRSVVPHLALELVSVLGAKRGTDVDDEHGGR